jgi:hypothetical protein
MKTTSKSVTRVVTPTIKFARGSISGRIGRREFVCRWTICELFGLHISDRAFGRLVFSTRKTKGSARLYLVTKPDEGDRVCWGRTKDENGATYATLGKFLVNSGIGLNRKPKRLYTSFIYVRAS